MNTDNYDGTENSPLPLREGAGLFGKGNDGAAYDRLLKCLPWHIQEHPEGSVTIVDCERKTVAAFREKHSRNQSERRELAAFIATACNSHAANRETIRALTEALELIHADLSKAGVPSSHRPKGRHQFSQKEQVRIAADRARAALALAKEAAGQTPKP